MKTIPIVMELMETKEKSHSFRSGYITALIDHNIISEDVHSELETIIDQEEEDQEEGYSKLSETLKLWRREVEQHCSSGIECASRVFDKASYLEDLNQIRHEFNEILDHLK